MKISSHYEVERNGVRSMMPNFAMTPDELRLASERIRAQALKEIEGRLAEADALLERAAKYPVIDEIRVAIPPGDLL